jgi:hypothetical protein
VRGPEFKAQTPPPKIKKEDARTYSSPNKTHEDESLQAKVSEIPFIQMSRNKKQASNYLLIRKQFGKSFRACLTKEEL